MATNYHSQRSVSASSIDSGGGTVTSSSRPAAADANGSALSKRLDALLSSGGRGGEDGRDGVADDGDFSVPGYLNLALSSGDDAENVPPNDAGDDEDDGALQTRMAELALQLQIETQRCHDDIEKIGMEVRAALPRAEADVARLGVGLDGMRQDAAGLLRDSAPFVVEDESSEERRDDATTTTTPASEGEAKKGDGSGGRPPPPLETLSTLHALRTNLGLTKSILSAASSWDATVTRIPALLSPPSASTDTTNLPPAASPASPTAGGNNTTVANLSEATQALITLRHGSRALRGMPGREEREATIEDFQSRIEVLLKPRLLHALQTGVSGGAAGSTSGGPLQQIADTYKLLGRTDTLVEEYVRARPAAVHRSWFAFVSPVPGGGGGGLGGTAADDDEEEEEEEIPVVGEDDDDYYRDRDAEARKREARERRGRERERERLEAFVGWLPGWYDGVAALLSEERRRSAAVFGPDAAPEIVARVLAECFRPLLSSFSTRLSALFPPDADASQPASGGVAAGGGGVGGGSTSTSFEAVCAAYESTLRFLSLAYDPMLGAPTSAVRDAFASVASPFAPYQRNLAALELRHSGEAAAAVSRDVQEAGRLGGGAAGASGLTALQNAVDRLAELSTLVFPLADAALSRFELLNCGYNTPAALSTIDTLITNHISELAITIGTLSATMTDDGDALAKAFDEQHVHCALEVLRMAGSFVRSLDAFERRTRDRLRNMCTGMRASVAQMEGEEGGGAGADSLSIVEVGALLARSVCEGEASSSSSRGGGDKVAAIAQLQRLSGESRPGSASRRRSSQLPDLLPSSRGASVRLAGTCHGFVFDVLYAVPRMWLRDVSSLPVWREGGRGGGGGGGEAALDSYSILPQQYITQVGEHILALVQALEPFASNGDALALANEVMNGVEEVAVQPWKELVGAAGCSDAMKEDDGVVGDLMKGKELKKYLLSQGDDSFDLGHEEDDEGDDDSAKFCNEWLSVVGSAVSGRVLERVLRIPKLSTKGGGNLVADLNYLVNVFSALGISGHPHPLLNHFASSIAMDGAELRQMIDAKSGETDELARTICAMEMRIAAMRGVEMRG